MLLGVSDRSLGPIQLTWDLKVLGMPGCLLQQDLVVTAGFAAKQDCTAQLPLPIPGMSGLSGLPFYVQGFVIAAQATPGNAVLTNGVALIPR